jgi:Tfp pilus assembly protein PilF
MAASQFAQLGFVHCPMGAIDLTIQYFNEALMLDEHERVAFSQMAEIRAIPGRIDKAEQYLSGLAAAPQAGGIE